MEQPSDVLYTRSMPTVSRRTAIKPPHHVSIPHMLTKRSLGFTRRPLSFSDTQAATMYSSFDLIDSNKLKNNIDKYRGGIFHLEFSLDGKILAAACEGKQTILYDAANQKQIAEMENAHLSCVNCIRFLDDYTFATGSDDSLIKLWDIRKLNKSKRTLQGHSSWVKNIEWSERNKMLVTSAFDGAVYAWDLADDRFQRVFFMSGLMRMKLTPDGTKMVISSTTGFLFIVHDLNLATIERDLKHFKPRVYRLMQTSEQSFPIATMHNHLFSPTRTRNRVEFIDDFPNEAEVISSLQIHPHSWAAVSRNLNSEENEEWTAVHDIQTRDKKDYEDSYFYVEECDMEGRDDDEEEAEASQEHPNDLWLGNNLLLHLETVDTIGWQNYQEVVNLNSGLIGRTPAYELYFQRNPNERNRIVKNLKRMTHCIKERNVGKGFIKGLSFSADGRVICSPFDKGIRLLAFSDNCQEMSECVRETPQELKTIVEMENYHSDYVVSCRFSPTHYQLVTGCLGSEIKWYQPVL